MNYLTSASSISGSHKLNIFDSNDSFILRDLIVQSPSLSTVCFLVSGWILGWAEAAGSQFEPQLEPGDWQNNWALPLQLPKGLQLFFHSLWGLNTFYKHSSATLGSRREKRGPWPDSQYNVCFTTQSVFGVERCWLCTRWAKSLNLMSERLKDFSVFLLQVSILSIDDFLLKQSKSHMLGSAKCRETVHPENKVYDSVIMSGSLRQTSERGKKYSADTNKKGNMFMYIVIYKQEMHCLPCLKKVAKMKQESFQLNILKSCCFAWMLSPSCSA